MTIIVPVKRGDTLSLLFTAKNARRVAQPLTGCSARLQLRNKAGNRVYVNASSAPGEGLTIDESAGTVALDVPYTATELLDPETCYGDLELTWDTGERRSSETFQVKFCEDQTRDIPA